MINHGGSFGRSRSTRDADGERETPLSEFLDSLPAGALITDGAGSVVYANRYMKDNFYRNRHRGKREIEPSIEKPDDGTRRGMKTVTLGDGSGRVIETLEFRIGKSGPLTGSLAVEITDSVREAERLKAALAEKELLLREMNHRVKNNFQIMEGLLRFQALKASDPGLSGQFDALNERIRAMAAVHERLSESGNTSMVDFADFVRTIAGELGTSYRKDEFRVRIDVAAAPLELDINLAIPCALILNEILTNAFKYAFPPSRQKRARVSISLALREGGLVELAVRDSGIGIKPGIEPGKTESLGMTLISMLTVQLGGELLLDREGGTAYTLTFPQG
jgi:two-component sensor histidine kinase